jgi:hypothetical protein
MANAISQPNHRSHAWDGVARLITALTPIFLAIITYFTIANGNKAGQAAVAADSAAAAAALTRQTLLASDSVQIRALDTIHVTVDTIHDLVNSAKDVQDSVNQVLRNFIRSRGFAQPPGTSAPRRRGNGASATQGDPR